MKYDVLGVLPIGKNTSVIISGDGRHLKNGISIKDENGKSYNLLSIGMDAGKAAKDMGKTTALLIEGGFEAKSIIV